MNPLSPSSATPGTQQRHASDAVEPLLAAEANAVDAQIPEEAEDNSNELEDGVDNRAITTTTTEADAVEHEAEDDSDGRITINLSGTAMRLLISRRIGRCLRRLTSIGWRS